MNIAPTNDFRQNEASKSSDDRHELIFTVDLACQFPRIFPYI